MTNDLEKEGLLEVLRCACAHVRGKTYSCFHRIASNDKFFLRAPIEIQTQMGELMIQMGLLEGNLPRLSNLQEFADVLAKQETVKAVVARRLYVAFSALSYFAIQENGLWLNPWVPWNLYLFDPDDPEVAYITMLAELLKLDVDVLYEELTSKVEVGVTFRREVDRMTNEKLGIAIENSYKPWSVNLQLKPQEQRRRASFLWHIQRYLQSGICTWRRRRHGFDFDLMENPDIPL